MTHLIDREFVAALSKAAAPLATAIAEETIKTVFTEAIVPLVVKATAQAADAQLLAEQAAIDSVEAMERAKIAKAAIAEELAAVADDIRAELDQFQPTTGGYAYITSRRP